MHVCTEYFDREPIGALFPTFSLVSTDLDPNIGEEYRNSRALYPVYESTKLPSVDTCRTTPSRIGDGMTLSSGKVLKSKKMESSPDDIFNDKSVHYPNVAGIDIGSKTHYVSVPEDRCADAVRTFGCSTPDVIKMADWLKECGIEHVVMESTGVYWMPVHSILTEAGFEVQLVDARHCKHVPGRKTDVWDAKWIRKLHTYGLLRSCFLPPAEVENMRTYWRHRANLIAKSAKLTQQMQKSLEMMNIQFHKVVADITGVTGMAIIRDIVAGVRDPQILIKHRRSGLKHSEQDFIDALTGAYNEAELFLLRQALDAFDFNQKQITECDLHLKACLEFVPERDQSTFRSRDLPTPAIVGDEKRGKRCHSANAPKVDLHSELVRIAGVDLSKIDGISVLTFQTIISECGPNLGAKFRTEKHFASWLGLCPNNIITGGRVRSSRSSHVTSRASNAFRMAAMGLHSSPSSLGAYYRRQRARLGPMKANVATAHKIAVQVWRMLVYGEKYIDVGQEEYEKRTAERAKQGILKKAKALGLVLVDPTTGEVATA